ncbi:MAG: DUF945 family protein [Gammaproteobacteria bacterium]|nr:DUF945 family protein [Gammaproteobacteria bacterium]
MRRANKFILSFVSVLGVLAFVAPFIMGVAIKHSFNRLVAFSNSEGNIKIEVKEYKRGWFYSNAILSMTVVRPELHKLSTMLSEKGDLFPQSMTFTLQEHINHGPILIHLDPSHFVSFHMAFVNTNVHLSSELAKFVRPLDLNKPIFNMQSIITFSGTLLQRIEMSPILMTFPDGESTIQFDGLISDMMVRPYINNIMGSVKTSKIQLVSHGIVIESPMIMSSFNSQLLPSGFWVGHTKFSTSEISAHDATGKSLAFVGMDVKNVLKEVSGLLYGVKEFTIKSIQMNSQEIGSISLNLSADGLNAQGVSLFLAGYKNFLQEDNVAGGEVRQQFLQAIPKMIHPGADIKVANLQVKTPDGDLAFSGSVSWPENLRTLPQTVGEILQLTNAKSDMRVSIPLAKELSGLGVDLFYMRYASPSFAPGTKAAEDAVDEEKRQNALTMAVLMQDDQLSRDAGKALLKLQSDNVSKETYANALDEMLKNKKVSTSGLRILKSAYRDVVYVSLSPSERRDLLQQEFLNKLDGWAKAGYLKQEKEAYVVSLDYKNSVLRANGKKVSLED